MIVKQDVSMRSEMVNANILRFTVDNLRQITYKFMRCNLCFKTQQQNKYLINTYDAHIILFLVNLRKQ